MDRDSRSRGGSKKRVDLPNIINKYNKCKVGVDVGDQRLQAYEKGALMRTISNCMAGTESEECMEFNRYAIMPFSVGLIFTIFKLVTNSSAKNGIPLV